MAMTIDQSSGILREVLAQATGRKDLARMNSGQLLSLGQLTVPTGKDPLHNAISQVLTRTLFDIRTYRNKFAGLVADPFTYGNWDREIIYADDPDDVENNGAYENLADGQTTDQYKVKKQKVLQLNFTDQKTWQIPRAIYEDQMDTAFNSMSEWTEFISGIYTFVANKIAKIHEETGRVAAANLAAATSTEAGQTVHLWTEYKKETGVGGVEPPANFYDPVIFPDFVRWIFARINTYSDKLEEYSLRYHVNLTGYDIPRTTPKADQRFYMISSFMEQVKNRVSATTYNAGVLKLPGYNEITYWQSDKPGDEMRIDIGDVKLLNKADGSEKTQAVKLDKVLGVMFDVRAARYCPIKQKHLVTPLNARGEYRVHYWKGIDRTSINLTQNAIVFLLD